MAQTGQWDLYERNVRGKTLLHRAVEADNREIVDFMVNRTDFDLHTPDKRGRGAFCTAVKHRRTKIAVLLLKAGANPTLAREKFGPVRVAMLCGDLKTIKKSVKYHGRVREIDVRWAAEAGNMRVLDYLLNAHTGEAFWVHALLMAAEADRLRIVQWLVLAKKVFIVPKGFMDQRSRLISCAKANVTKWLLTRPGFGDFAFRSCALTALRRVNASSNRRCLKLKRANVGNSCCKLVAKAMVCRESYVKNFQVIDLRDNPRIGKEGVEVLVESLQSLNPKPKKKAPDPN